MCSGSETKAWLVDPGSRQPEAYLRNGTETSGTKLSPVDQPYKYHDHGCMDYQEETIHLRH